LGEPHGFVYFIARAQTDAFGVICDSLAVDLQTIDVGTAGGSDHGGVACSLPPNPPGVDESQKNQHEAACYDKRPGILAFHVRTSAFIRRVFAEIG
jgi:hypothetical protein